jgi:hypothetical protein
MLRAPRSQAIDQVVVLYASGDGGWRGAAVDMFHQIAKAGYYTIGFSSRAFLNVERRRGALVALPSSRPNTNKYSTEGGSCSAWIRRVARS